MKIHAHLKLSEFEEWEGFIVRGRRLELPTGDFVTPQQVITGIALLQIQSDLEIKSSRKLLKLARTIARLM